MRRDSIKMVRESLERLQTEGDFTPPYEEDFYISCQIMKSKTNSRRKKMKPETVVGCILNTAL